LKFKFLNDKRYRLILKSSISGIIFRIISLIFSFISVPIILNYLGKFNYGLWITLSSSISLIGYADFGIGNGLLNLLSRNYTKIRNKKTIISSAFFSLSIISIISLFLFYFLYHHSNFSFFSNDFTIVNTEIVKESIYYLVLFFFVSLPFSIVFKIEEANQEGYYVNVFNLIGILINIIFLTFVIHFKLGIIQFVFLNSTIPLLTYISNWIYLFSIKKYRILFPSFKYFNLSTSKNILHQGLFFFILSFFTIIGSSSDNIIISKILNIESVTDFEIARKLFSIVALTNIFLTPIWPAFSEALANNDIVWARKTFRKTFKLGLIICTIITLIVIISSNLIIHFWIGDKVILKYSYLVLFGIASILSFYGGLMSVFINGTPVFQKQIPLIIMTTIFSILLKFILTKNIGISGILLGTIISNLIFYIIPIYKLLDKHLKTYN
jgi:O-antigen/teichoic acid export membrane protein